MIKFIAAIDEQRGMANDYGIPWQGKIPKDVKHFRDKTSNSVVLMGFSTYVEFTEPLSDRRNLVASSQNQPLRDGFELVLDARDFLKKSKEDVWVIGGAGLFAQTIDLADELHLTQLEGEFGCTKFFPPFKDRFTLVSESDSITENGITYRFQLWRADKK